MILVLIRSGLPSPEPTESPRETIQSSLNGTSTSVVAVPPSKVLMVSFVGYSPSFGGLKENLQFAEVWCNTSPEGSVTRNEYWVTSRRGVESQPTSVILNGTTAAFGLLNVSSSTSPSPS